MTDAPALPLVDIDEIVPDEDLLTEMRRTRVTTPVTRVLLALVVIAGTFLLGAVVARSQYKPSSASGAESLIAQIRAATGGATGASGASGATGGSGAPAGLFGGAGGGTFGTVKLVDGANVYVEDMQGNVIKITTKPTTTVSVTKDGTVSDLAPGSTVIVQGKQSADGASVAATSISQSAGLGGRGPGGLGGNAGG
jgi:hypothetical protein